MANFLIDEAKQLLIVGDNNKAEALFRHIKKSAASHIVAAAEANYQLGKLAEDDIRYRDAYQHFDRAAQLAPNNTDYLMATGAITAKLEEYEKAIGYFEQAIAVLEKELGSDHPSTKKVVDILERIKADVLLVMQMQKKNRNAMNALKYFKDSFMKIF
ncbi:MAG: tetratricopeptide repeat protein [Pseudomonadales bacterium]